MGEHQLISHLHGKQYTSCSLFEWQLFKALLTCIRCFWLVGLCGETELARFKGVDINKEAKEQETK